TSMLTNLELGTALIALTVVTHTIGLVFITKSMRFMIRWLRLHTHVVGKTIAMVSTVLALFLLHTVEVWTWAVILVLVGALGAFAEALYFSTVTFSTLGYGDVT